nr:hypothetical protein [Tanacetum cinerariifolium]
MGLRVLPVFYHVNPSDLRGQKRNYATAFQQHEEKYRGGLEKVNRWRKALVEASNLSGWHFSNSLNSGEYDFIKKIEQDVFHNIKPQGMEDNLIGMEFHMDALRSLLDTEETKEARVIGIWGMGGIGKTTIAKALFRRNVYKFDCSSFVKDVRVNSSREKDICVLQEKILNDIQQIPRTKIKIRDCDYGLRLIKKAFFNKKVLLVLDDVDDIKQLEFLAASHKWFGQGSRIIITTRDKHVLVVAHANYKPNCLLVDQAIELFSRHAFQKNRPPEGYEDLSLRAIHYTGYLPLALKVFGSFFRGREAIVWENIFGHCMFLQGQKEHVTRILDSFGFNAVIGISALIEKSLITVSNAKLDMHDLIQDMGLKIAHESFFQSRLWELEDIHDVVNMNGILELVQAIVLPRINYDKEQGMSADVFREMINLRLLDVDSAFTSSEPNFLPYNLRWLRWESYPYLSLPVEQMRKLVGLYMCSGSMKHIWEGRQYLTSLPSMIEMESLETLILSGCFSLARFPDVSPLMVKLSKVYLDGCSRIEELPSSITHLSSLSLLNLMSCTNIKYIPTSICELRHLKSLYLHNCTNLQKLPEELGSMESLEELLLGLPEMYNCGRLPPLIHFQSLKILCSLRRLDLSWRQIDEESFPRNLGEFFSLEDLYLSGNCKLTHLPAGISQLSHLKLLEVTECSKLRVLNALPSGIQIWKARGCMSLEKIEDLSEVYEWLYKVWVFDCDRLLENQEHRRYLDKMLEQSFLK